MRFQRVTRSSHSSPAAAVSGNARLVTSIRVPWIAVLAVSLFGLTDEWHQSFTPGRFVEVADWVADTLGAIVAVTIYVRWPRARAALEHPLWRRQRRIEKPDPLVPNEAA